MNKTKVFSNVNQIVNGTSVTLQNLCLKSKDILGVHTFAAVKHWLVLFVNLQHDVSLTKIGFFSTGPGISLCARGGGGVTSRAAISFSSACCSVGGLLPCLPVIIPAQLA